MTRALSVLCLTVAFALLGAATADAKPTVAVLGLEVANADSTIDQQSTAAAGNLTVALRDRVRSGTGPYDTAGGSDKELIDLKLLNECSSEASPCMAKIGSDLGAKFMLYGHIAKSGSVYRVTMVLFNVDTKSKVTTKNYDIPIADLAAGPKSNETLVWARKVYGEMTGATSAGNVVVHVTGADRGTLLVEENGQWQPKGSITSNTGRTSLPEGRYKIAVESEGFQRFEQTVTVTAGQDTNVPVELAPMPRTGPSLGSGSADDGVGTGNGSDHIYGGTISDPGGNHTGLKIGAWTTLALAAGAGGVWIQAAASLNKYDKNPETLDPKTPNMDPKQTWDSSHCGDAMQPGGPGGKAYQHACSSVTRENFAVGSTIGFALVSAGLFYFAYRGGDEHAPPPGTVSGRKHREHPTMAFIPVMTPQGAGATFRLDW